MILTPSQSIIAKDTHRFRVLRCGRRFGKTKLGVEEMKGIGISKPSRIAYIATTNQQARDIVWKELNDELRGATSKTNEARLEITTKTLKGGESTFFLKGWESIETLRGQAFDFLVIDEIAMMRNFWVYWNEVLRPTLTDRKGQALFASTPKGFNHFYDLCNLELKDPSFKTFHFTTWDNPYIPIEEIEAAKNTLPLDVFSQEYEANFEKTEGMVYKEFSRKFHIYDTLPKAAFDYIGGIDFGYRNPAAVLHIYTDGERFFVDDEWYKAERTDAQIAEYVSSCRFRAVYPDPENQGGIEELRRQNVNTREVSKFKGSVSAGIQLIRELLLNNRLKVNKRCVNLISEFEMYSYDKNISDRNEKEEPVKANDHALDALRYVVLTHKPINRIDEAQRLQALQARKSLTQTNR